MQCFVIEGDKKYRDEFIEKLIQEHSIVPYNIYTCVDKIKMSDVRDMKKTLSRKLGQNESRLVHFNGQFSLDAQNALLKSLEEADSSTFFIISCDRQEELLPTILSRCQIFSYIVTQDLSDDTVIELFDALSQKKSAPPLYALVLTEKIKLATTEDLKQLIQNMRQHFLQNIESNNIQEIKRYYTLLQKFQENYQFLIQNNVNKKFFFETILLSI